MSHLVPLDPALTAPPVQALPFPYTRLCTGMDKDNKPTEVSIVSLALSGNTKDYTLNGKDNQGYVRFTIEADHLLISTISGNPFAEKELIDSVLYESFYRQMQGKVKVVRHILGGDSDRQQFEYYRQLGFEAERIRVSKFGASIATCHDKLKAFGFQTLNLMDQQAVDTWMADPNHAKAIARAKNFLAEDKGLPVEKIDLKYVQDNWYWNRKFPTEEIDPTTSYSYEPVTFCLSQTFVDKHRSHVIANAQRVFEAREKARLEKERADVAAAIAKASRKPCLATWPRRHLPPPAVVRTKQEEFLHNLKPAEQEALLKEVHALPASATAEQIKAFKEGNWSHAVYQQPKWQMLAVRAFLEGNIDEMHLAKLLYYFACVNVSTPTHPLQPLQLMNKDKQIDAKALDLLTRSLHTYFSKAEITAFATSLQTLPVEESQFFAVTAQPFSFDQGAIDERFRKDASTVTFLEFLFHSRGLPLLLVQTKPGQMTQLVLPPRLLNLLLKAKFGATTMQSTPVLGLSKGADFENVATRPLLVPSPLPGVIKDATVADNYGTPNPLVFTHHDGIFHLFLESGNPHREAWIELAAVFKKENLLPMISSQAAESMQKQNLFFKLRRDLLDREFPAYSDPAFQTEYAGEAATKAGMKPQEKFWLTLAATCHGNVERLYGDESAAYFLEVTMTYLTAYEKEWKAAYGIDLQSLTDFYAQQQTHKHDKSVDLLEPLVTFKPKLAAALPQASGASAAAAAGSAAPPMANPMLVTKKEGMGKTDAASGAAPPQHKSDQPKK